jgi:RNA polymerase sigma-70 factor, ECF subfamily
VTSAPTTQVITPAERAAFEAQITASRPKLHRYCARMVGSALDGEDVLQEALIKAIEAFPRAAPIANVEAWLIRIAHNTALDVLRRKRRHDAVRSEEDPDMIADDSNLADRRQAVAASLATFMRLPVAQRASVILMDVLGYSLDEIGEVTGATIPAVKAALHRGRTRLRDLAALPADRALPALAAAERARLTDYVARFNARDFDALRALLAEDVRLDLVARHHIAGRHDVGNYFSNYERLVDWHLTPAMVEGRPAALVRAPGSTVPAVPYVVLLGWSDGGLVAIRDFRYARYVMDSAEVVPLD